MTAGDPRGVRLQADVPRLAVTAGDPRGVGPEVAAKALAALAREGTAYFARVVGPVECAEAFASLPRCCEFEPVEGGAAGLAPGRAAGLAVERATALALGGEASAVVTAPLEKPALARAGYRPGHTEMLAELCGAARVGMLMCADEAHAAQSQSASRGGSPRAAPKRVLLATTHVALAQVPALVTSGLLVSQTRLLSAALRAHWRIAVPRIALCALNPHASDGGLFGSEEQAVYPAALEILEDDPAVVSGPFPADTVFGRAFSGEFDAVVAPYHDVGMAAFKTAAFRRGVNATIGLPFPRTSPDHGTAFAIAGQDAADPSSMTEAVRLAIHLASQSTDDAWGAARCRLPRPLAHS